MDKTPTATADVALPSSLTLARPVRSTPGLWLFLSAQITLVLTLLAVVYLATLSF